MTTNYLVERSELSPVNLMARDQGLVRSSVAAVDEARPGFATQRFLRKAARSAGRTDDLTLLNSCTGLRERETSISWLFGVDVVSRAPAAMVGAGNKLSTDLQVHRGSLTRRTVLTDLEQIRKEKKAVSDREIRPAGPQRSILGGFAAPEATPEPPPPRPTMGWEPGL